MLRIIVASYFIAGAFGVVPGTDFSILTAQVMPAPFDEAVAMGIVFFLGYLVMAGHWLRGAALTLGLLTFWASYVTMFSLGVEAELGGFWRDIALVAALMLTYSAPCPSCGFESGPILEGSLDPDADKARLSEEEVRVMFRNDLEGRSS